MTGEKEMKVGVIIEFWNLDQEQAMQLIDLFYQMQECGERGRGRWLCFYADGDGAFCPKILNSSHQPLIGGHLLETGKWKEKVTLENAYVIVTD